MKTNAMMFKIVFNLSWNFKSHACYIIAKKLNLFTGKVKVKGEESIKGQDGLCSNILLYEFVQHFVSGSLDLFLLRDFEREAFMSYKENVYSDRQDRVSKYCHFLFNKKSGKQGNSQLYIITIRLYLSVLYPFP